MNEAFTVRLRASSGRHFFWTAPAGGMGLSSPCCASGHDSVTGALDCGTATLRTRLAPPELAVA